jgi:hypothetical protein
MIASRELRKTEYGKSIHVEKRSDGYSKITGDYVVVRDFRSFLIMQACV